MTRTINTFRHTGIYGGKTMPIGYFTKLRSKKKAQKLARRKNRGK